MGVRIIAHEPLPLGRMGRDQRGDVTSTRRALGRAVGSPSLGLVAQQHYVERMSESGFEFGLTVAEAFVRGIRDIGYRSTGTALDELIDNAIQAEADTILIAFQLDRTRRKPVALAVIDNGCGMSPTMCRLAAIWGGTHRENDRSGFGRYGYGLPTACVSQGRRFTIYSRLRGAALHNVTLDVEEIGQGRYTDSNGRVVVPSPGRARLPSWVEAHVREHMPGGQLERGTVVLIEKLDRLTRATGAGLERHLVDHFGVTYRNWLDRVYLKVQGAPVEPIDPLFLAPAARFYDFDADRARSFEPIEIPVPHADSGEILGTLHVRYAFFPPTFASLEKSRGAVGRNANPRFQFMVDHNGIIFLRLGRQIDVVTRGLGAPFQNNDRYWKVEVDFPSTLDEEFGITTSKQRIDVSSRIWDILRQAGVGKAIDQLRRLNTEARSQVGLPESGYLDRRPSEIAMTRGPGSVTSDNRYKVVVEAAPGAPFFRSERTSKSLTLVLNTAHPFFTDLYAAGDGSYRLRNALEVMLFALADSFEEEGGGLGRHIDVARWSSRMWDALPNLAGPLESVSGP